MYQRLLRRLRRSPGSALALAALILGALALFGGPTLAAPLDATLAPSCTLSGTTRACDLYAVTGAMPAASLPGAASSVPVWGYNTSNAAVTAPGGPTLVVRQGETVQVTLHNGLTEASSLDFVGQGLASDTTGAPAGGTKTYTFVASRPGTFLYQAGMVAGSATAIGGPRQVLMGLYGALVVLPATPGSVFGDAVSAYDDETVLVYGEIDPAFNAGPLSFKLQKYAPKYELINGKTYPNTAPIAATAGSRLLLREVNAGGRSHSFGALGLRQSVVGIAGAPTVAPIRVAAQTIAAGQTVDALIAVPTSTPDGTRYALYDTGTLQASRTGVNALTGAVTFITVSATPASGDTQGPATSGVTVAPLTATAASLSAQISDAATGGSNVDTVEYTIDGGVATQQPIGPATTVGFNATVDISTLGTGQHTFYVRGRDSAGNWGPAGSAILLIDKTGPSVTTDLASPNPTNGTGSAAVALQVTASDVSSGNSDVDLAEYFVDSAGADGSGTAMTLQTSIGAHTTASFTASVPVGALPEGAHSLLIHARDVAGNWGALTPLALIVDRTGPAATAITVQPSPNNGTLIYGGTSGGAANGVRVDATLTDPLIGGGRSNVVSGELFVDSLGAAGTGYLMQPRDGQFNSTSETAYAVIPTAQVQLLAAGNHTIYVVGVDAAGNRGAAGTGTLTIDRGAPAVSGVTLTPSAANSSAVAIGATASDVATGNSNIAAGEFFIDTAGAAGTGTAMTASAAAPSTTVNGTIPAATVAALTVGNHTVYVRARDAAGNWSATASATLLIDRTAPAFSSITIAPSTIIAGVANVTLAVNGASDGAGGSGVVGGEYWFGTTNPAPGGGTAFAGLTASVPTGTLAPGTYTIRARIRDAAGNWSTSVSGATLTVVADAIFSSGFETGTFAGWTSRSTTNTGRLNVTNAAALLGSWGLQAQGNNTNYVQSNFTPATATYDARFYFNPNNNASTGQDIFAAATSGTFGTQLFHVRYQRNGAQPRVQIQVGNNPNGSWVNITNNASNRIEVVWQAGGSLQLYVNGTLSQTLTAGGGSVGAIRLGSVTSGGSATIEYFDAFASKRSVSPLLGP